MFSKQILLTKLFLLIILVNLFYSCQTNYLKIPKKFSKVEVKHILLDSTLNIRALEISDNMVYNASSVGEIYSFTNDKTDLINVVQYRSKIDSILNPNVRS